MSKNPEETNCRRKISRSCFLANFGWEKKVRTENEKNEKPQIFFCNFVLLNQSIQNVFLFSNLAKVKGLIDGFHDPYSFLKEKYPDDKEMKVKVYKKGSRFGRFFGGASQTLTDSFAQSLMNQFEKSSIKFN